MKKDNLITDIIVSVCDFLTLLFLALQCASIIDWSWWQLLLPTIACRGAGIIMLLLYVLLAALVKEEEDG
jgi:hypothetical protein